MRDTPVQMVIFDLGRVLVNYDVLQTYKALSAFTTLSEAEVHELTFCGEGLERFRLPYDTGKFTCEEFFGHMQQRLLLKDMDFEEFRRHWSDITGPADGTDELLRRMRPGVKRGILSNIDPLNWGVAKSMPMIQQHFLAEHCTLSWEEKLRKPDAEIYRTAARRLRCNPRAGLYIDDRAENVKAARLVGFFAEQYNTLEDPVSKLEDILLQHGALD